MDGKQPVLPHDLHARLGTAAAPLVLDVRPQDAFAADDRLIIGASRRSPDNVEEWRTEFPSSRPVVVYCSDGDGVSRGVAAALAGAGVRAGFVEGGFSHWKDLGLPTRKRDGGGSQKWVTREHPKIDRIACPWLISRFIDPGAEFIYVPADQVAAVAKQIGGTPYDIKGVKFGHVGDRCSFDAIVAAYDIHDAALDHLATIVRGADTSRPDLTPQCEGLLAISYGLSGNFSDDHEMLRHGMVMYDALYTWCRQQAPARPAA
jgi:rhodanese-related sulfurtransferase